MTRPLPMREVEPDIFEPALDAAGTKVWDALWTDCPWLGDGDVEPALRYAHLFDEAHECRQLIARDGRTARGSMGQVTTAPPVEQLRQIETQMLRLESVLGVGTLHRKRLGELAEAPHVPDALDDLQERRRKRHEAAKAAEAPS